MALLNCPECKREISDTASACIHCGYDFKAINETKKKNEQKSAVFQVIAVIALIVAFFTPRILLNIVLLVVLGSAIISLVRKEKNWVISFLTFILGVGLLLSPLFEVANEMNYKIFVKVKNYSWDKTSSKNYSYIRGSVINDGDKTLRYFKVKASFLDYSDNVIDSEITIERVRLESGESKEFEIMHPSNYAYQSVRVEVEEFGLE